MGWWVAFLLGPCPGSRPACLAVLTSPWLDSARQAASPRGCESYWPTSRITPRSWSTIDDLPIDRAVFREPMGQGGGASWRHALHGARLLTYSPFFSCVLRRRWGTSYSVGVRGSGMMRHIRRVLPGGRSSFAGDPVDFCQEVGRVLLAARSSFAGGRLGFAGRSVEFCRRPVDFCWPWVAHLPTPGEIAVLVEMPFLAPTLNCQLGLGAQRRRADSAGYAGPIGDQTQPN